MLELPFALVPALEALGRRHAGYGVEGRHYDTVGGALLDTLAECLGRTFTPKVRDAWAALYTIVLSGVASYAILKLLAVTIGLRVSESDERQGLDLSEHGENAYDHRGS